MAGHHNRPWYKRYPSDFLAGTRGMRPILHKTYTRVLDGMYEYGGPLPYDLLRLTHLVEVRPRDLPHILDELVAAGKIEIIDGFIHNKRTDNELAKVNGQNANIEPTQAQHSLNLGPTKPQHKRKLKAYSGKNASKNYARASDPPHDHAHPSTEAEAEGNKALPTAESFITNALPSEVGSLRPAANGAVEGSALEGERSLEGRSPPEPSEKVEEALHISEALKRSKLVSKATGFMAALQPMPKEDDDAEQA